MIQVVLLYESNWETISAKTHKCYTSNHLFENRGIKVFFFLSKEKYDWDFSGGMADKNAPANAGDTGLILGPGRFKSLQATANELLSHNY